MRLLQIGAALTIVALLSLLLAGGWGALQTLTPDETGSGGSLIEHRGRVVDFAYRQLGADGRRLVLKVELRDGRVVDVEAVRGLAPEIGAETPVIEVTGDLTASRFTLPSGSPPPKGPSVK